MLYAILSDIHGNDIALKVVLKQICQRKITRLLIAGDFLGYYYHPEKVFKLLSAWNWIGIQGNHETCFNYYLKKDLELIQLYREKFGSSLDMALFQLSQKQISIIKALEETKELVLGNKRILLVHGSPWNQNEYIYRDSSPYVWRKIKSIPYDYLISGHTHYPFIKHLNNITVLNPGSIGQPRDYGSLASWIEADFDKKITQIYRVKFDPKKIIEEINEYDPQKHYLTEVLTREISPNLLFN